MAEDIVAMIGAVTREVRDAERDGQKVRIVIAARDYDTDLDDLWDAITNPERLPRWFAPVTGDFKLGGRFQIKGNADGTITACAAPHTLALSWEFAGQLSWVEVALSASGAGARLELQHIAPIDPHWAQYGPGATGVGWELGLFGLAWHLRDPAAQKPPEADAEWLASADAKHFIALSSAAWGDADIANGAEAASARAAAEATRKFYSGEA